MAKSIPFKLLKKILAQESNEESQENSELNNSFIDRREFMKRASALALMSVPVGKLMAKTFSQANSSIMILGGGLAGLTAAYELKKAGINSEIFEASARLGGRIFTKNNFNSEGMFCELGGELIDSDHNYLLNLAHELNCAIDDFAKNERGSNLEPYHYYFGGKHYFEKEILEDFLPLKRKLKKDIYKLFASNMFRPKINYRHHSHFAVELDHMTLADYLKQVEVKLWVRDFIDVAYKGEYGLNTSEQSALNLLMLYGTVFFSKSEVKFSPFGGSDESMRIRGGNSRLVEALHENVKSHCEISVKAELVKIRKFNEEIVLTFKNGQGVFEKSAKFVVCTLPFSVLRNIEGIEHLGLSETKLKCIQAIGYGTNSKYMMGFSSRHWTENTADFMASTGYTFTDLKSQAFWDSSRSQKGQSGIITNFVGGKEGADFNSSDFNSAMDDLEKIYPGVRALHDQNETLFVWSKYQFSKGSYSCPRPGQWTTIVGSAGECELDGQLLFAGEHTSENNMGYMEGAVESGVVAAQKLIKRRGQQVTPSSSENFISSFQN